MARGRRIQTNFTSGEISPRLWSRVDFDKYFGAAETIENFIIFPHGGISRRAGTKFIAECADSTKVSRLIPFEFSDQETYVLEFANTVVRVFKNGGRIEETAVAITGAADNGSGLIRITTGASHGYSTGDPVSISAVLGTLEANIQDWVVTNVDATHFDLDGSVFTNAYTSGGLAAKIVEVGSAGTPWLEAELFSLQFAQSADVMWVCHPNHKPQKITRTSDIAWTLADYAPTGDVFTSTDNYPRGVGFWQSRLWFCGTNTNPDKVWSTQVDDFNNVNLGTSLDNEGIRRTLAGQKVSVLRWLMANGVLLAGSNGGETSLSGGSRQAAATPTNIAALPHTSLGSAAISPLVAKGRTVFVQRLGKTATGQKIQVLSYDFDSDSYINDEQLALLSEHIVQPSITQITYQQEPDSIIWALRSDGELISLTYLPDQEVKGWARHTTDGLFESVAAIPGAVNDVVYVTVKRTINGVTKRYIEFLEYEDGFYGQLGLDSALTATFGSPATSVGGLDHLEGKTVGILSDGAVEPNAVVTNGVVTLQDGGLVIEVGLNFTSTLKSLLPELETGGSVSMQNVAQSRPQISLRVKDSLGGTINGEVIKTRSPSNPMDAPPPTKTGLVKVENLGWGEDQSQVTVIQTQPLPLTILALIGDIEVGDF